MNLAHHPKALETGMLALPSPDDAILNMLDVFVLVRTFDTCVKYEYGLVLVYEPLIFVLQVSMNF